MGHWPAIRTWLVKAAWLVPAFLILGGMAWLMYAALSPFVWPTPSPLSPQEQAGQERARIANAFYRERKRYWLERIEAGDASFGEAACSLELHGDWDAEADRCDTSSDL